MPITLRKSVQLKNNILVIKLSSLAVTHEQGGLYTKSIRRVCKDIQYLNLEKKIKIVLVSSGAINAGKNYLKSIQSQNIADLQAASAVGQPILIQAFQKELGKLGLISAQVLLTHEDLKNKKRTLNIRSSLLKLVADDIIPIINENDTVSFDEITLGDNDQLSAMICETLNSDTLCMLTRTDGLFTDDPGLSSAKHISYVPFDETFSDIKTFSKSSTGRGGMKTKLQAVRKLTPLGTNVLIGTFEKKNPLLTLLTKEESGTFFQANPQLVKKTKKLWILNRTKNDAIISIDRGAMLALNKKSSLLPIGIISVSGKFDRGDCVQLTHQKKTVAYGIAEYSAKEIALIKRLKTNELKGVLAHVHSKVVIHVDNLILNKEGL